MKTLDFRAGLLDRAPVLVPVLMFLGFLALRVPFRAHFLVNWDSVNFALGTHHFNLENHQPHPPGYIGYIYLGRLLNYVTGDANTSLTTLSIISGAAAPVAFFLFASLFIPRRYALITAVLFGLSPVVWYYSEVALTYSVELAMVLFFLWVAFKARRSGSLRYLMTATVLLVLIGAVRQSGALFLIPLWLYVVWSFPWRRRLQAGAVMTGGSLLWLVPLLWLSGGIRDYMRISSELADLVVMPTSVFSMSTPGTSQNLAFVLAGVVLGVNLGLVIIAIGFYRRVNPFAVFMPYRRFFLVWLVPVLLTYIMLHTGQLGYVLLILPAPFLLVGAALAGMGARRQVVPRKAGSGFRTVPAHAYAVGIMAVALALSNTGAFLFFPRAINTLARSGETGAAQGLRFDPFTESPDLGPAPEVEGRIVPPDRTRPFDLRVNDAHWNSLIELVNAFEPGETAVLTTPNWEGSFRHFTYYLPEYRVYGIGRDLNGSFGLLFTAYQGTSDYAVRGLEQARHELYLPPLVQWLIIPDWEVARRILNVEVSPMTLRSGATVGLARVPRGMTLFFEQPEMTNRGG